MFCEKLTEEQIRRVMNVISDDGALTILKIRTYDKSFEDAVAVSAVPEVTAKFQEDIENSIQKDTKVVITAADRLDAISASLKKRGIRFYLTEHPVHKAHRSLRHVRRQEWYGGPYRP